jgi:hypothetical protein
MFYLLLRFFLSHRYVFLLLFLLVSFIFSPNFAWGAIYSFSAFYPLAISFLILYTYFVKKWPIPIKGILIGIILFIGLQSFHLIPAFIDLFAPGTAANARVFLKANIADQISAYFGLLSFAQPSVNILAPSPIKGFAFLSFFVPVVIVTGLLLNKKKEKTVLLTGIFFLITFYFLTSNVAYSGIKLYEALLLYVPGFTMFKDFIYIWKFVFAFFCALFFGQTLFIVFSYLKNKYVPLLFWAVTLAIVFGSWTFINGDLVTKGQYSTHVRSGITMDPQFESMLSFLRSSKEDTKVLTLPFNDAYMQPISGTNGAWYIGASFITSLTDKKDFAGYQMIYPFPNVFLQAAKNKDYTSLKRLLGLLNIRYIFLNSDPKLYIAPFYPWLFSYVSNYLPQNEKDYQLFVQHLSANKIIEKGYYSLYALDPKAYLPHFYPASKIQTYKDTVNDWQGKTYSFFVNQKGNDVKTVYIEENTCTLSFPANLCRGEKIFKENDVPTIEFEKINPTKYKIKVLKVTGPYLLVFSEAYYRNWKIFVSPRNDVEEKPLQTYFEGKILENNTKNIFLDNNTFETLNLKNIADNHHVLVNGYANGWYITPEDVGDRGNYELIVEMTGQRIFYVSLGISILTFIFCIGFGGLILLKIWGKRNR